MGTSTGLRKDSPAGALPVVATFVQLRDQFESSIGCPARNGMKIHIYWS